MEQYKFPDEIDPVNKGKPDVEIDIELEDDTPPEDRGRQPMPKEIVEKLEVDELDKYSVEAKEKLIQMKKVWHDERREKEAATRERQAAVEAAQKLLEENKRLRSTLSSGEKEYMSTATNAAELAVEIAKRGYREALETGEADKIIEAQQRMTDATLKLNSAKNYRPTLQNLENEVQMPQVQEQARPTDPKLQNWTAKNPWYGSKKSMTAFALGVHEELADEYGKEFIGSDQYYERLDKTVRKAFPDYFEALEPQTKVDEVDNEPKTQSRRASTVVASATRSTAKQPVKLKTSQQAIAKRLGLTNEQYARELLKLEL